jgi:hypothetical protein
MNCRAGVANSGRPGTGICRVPREIAMNAVPTPKSLPWLARRAGVPDHVADTLWREALALAGVGQSQAAEPRRQAEAMQTLLRLLGHKGRKPVGGAGAGVVAPGRAAFCQ